MSNVQLEREELRPLNVVMVFVVIATVLAVCFFTSPPPNRTPAGAIPWAKGSMLKELTDALAFDFSIPTPLGLAVKNLAFGVASGVSAMVVALGVFATRRSPGHEITLTEDESPPTRFSHLQRQIDPLQGAQLMFGGLVGLSFLSSLWAPMQEVAIGGSVILLGQCLWTFAIRFGLNARACKAVAIGMVVVLSTTATLAVGYYYERNQTLRVGYPIGNPLFFAACMIPAVMVCVCWLASGVGALARAKVRAFIGIGLCILALIPILWGIRLADPRSTYLALAAGMVCIVFFAVRGAAAKISVVVVTLVLGVVGYLLWLGPLLTHRPETIRTRLYAWSYAQELIAQSPIIGHGQGGFALLGDALAVNDVADDPRALHAHLAHAHNEWLETCVNLGSMGLVITLGCYALTLWAGVRALRQMLDPARRWLLIGLLASLAALIVEESFDVALRIAGLPTIFYAVLGMTWAVIASSGTGDAARPTPSKKSPVQGVISAGVVALGLIVSATALLDFRASRALYAFQEKLQQRQWDSAMQDVEFARQHRLSPNRKLTAYYSQAWCHLRIAEEFLRDFQGKAIAPADPQNRPPAALLRSYAQDAVDRAKYAIELAQQVSQHASRYYGIDRVAGAAFEIMGRLAALAGDQERAEQYRQAALGELRKELLRHPHDAGLVWHIIELSPDLGLADIIELICPPMRYHQVALRYFQLVQALANKPTFDVEFQPILAQAMTKLITGQPGAVEVTYPAQKLRIAAWVAVGRGNLSDAKAYAKNALDLSAKQKDQFPIAYAIAHRELAHFSFMDNPNEPQIAIEIAMRSNSLLPDSHESAPVKERTTHRLAMYYVALGDEEAAKVLIPGHSRLKPEALDAELTSLYLSLCQLMLTLPPVKRPDYFLPRVDRLYELSQTNQVPPQIKSAASMMKAQVAYQQADLSGCIQYWKDALSKGVDPRQVWSLAERASQAHPEHESLRQFFKELSALLSGPGPGGAD